jgi:hypothetical protein
MTFIQNVHHFRDDALIESGPPIEHVIIFNEAQHAWNLQQTASFMHRKKKLAGFSQSKPESLISFMNGHKDWAVITCLVGGGQPKLGDGQLVCLERAANQLAPNPDS